MVGILVPWAYDQIASAFNISADDIDFIDIYPLSDTLWSEDFQGIEKRYNFTDEEWDIVKQIQLPSLVELLSNKSRKIMVSRMVNPVLEMMKNKIGLGFNETLIGDFKDVERGDGEVGDFGVCILNTTVLWVVEYFSNDKWTFNYLLNLKITSNWNNNIKCIALTNFTVN
jgi:hypothetical protein